MLASFTAQGDGYTLKLQYRLAHDCIFAHEIKIELDAIVNDTRQFPNHQMDPQDVLSAGLLGVACNYLYDIFGDS